MRVRAPGLTTVKWEKCCHTVPCIWIGKVVLATEGGKVLFGRVGISKAGVRGMKVEVNFDKSLLTTVDF